MDHDGYSLFTHYWWLIFPLFWMVIAMARGWSRHSRANRALDIIKSYADQGKDPPPDLLKNLAIGGMVPAAAIGPYGWRNSPERRLGRAFFFAALACAFGFLTFWPQDDGNWHHHAFGLVHSMTAIFAALAFSNFLSLLFLPRGSLPPYDKDGNTR